MTVTSLQTQPSPFMTGEFVISGVHYPTTAYRMTDPKSWPTYGGIYAVSGLYDGNEGKTLVGQTACRRGFRGRWACYRRDLNSGDYGNHYLQSSFDRHGESQFVFWVLETGVSTGEIGGREAFWYHHLQSDADLNGWNLAIPMEGQSRGVRDETREKLRTLNLDKHHTEETRRKMSATRQERGTWNRGLRGEQSHSYGRTHSEETRAKLSANVRGEHNPWWGKKRSAEDRAMFSQRAARRIPIRVRSPEGEIMEFHALSAFARHIGHNEGRVRWFVRTAQPGESFAGWTVIEYKSAHGAAASHKVSHRKPTVNPHLNHGT